MVLGLPVLSAREPIEQRNNSADQPNADEHQHHVPHRFIHRSAPAKVTANATVKTQIAMPTNANPIENVCWRRNWPNTRPPTARCPTAGNA